MTHPNPSTAMARTLVDELARNGVRHVVLAPGSRSAPLAMAALAEARLAVHTEIDERSAAFLALGIGKASGRPAAVVTTSGTAVPNLHPAVVEADLSATPLLLLTADRPPEARDVGANQTIDQARVFRETRWSVDLAPAEDRPGEAAYWRSTLCRALAETRGLSGSPGPVHVNVPFREPLVPLTDDGRTAGRAYAADTGGRPGQEPWTRYDPLPQADGHAAGGEPARRPLVVLGAGAEGIPDLPPGVPVIAEAASGLRREGTVTTAHHLLGSERFRQLHRPDLVVTVGRVGLSPRLASFVAAADRHLVVASRGWPDPLRSADEVVGRLPSGLLRPETGWGDRWSRAEAAARKAVDDAIDRWEEPTEPGVARDLVRAMPAGSCLVAASSMPVRDLDWFMPPADVGLVANRGASGVDGFVSTALGVALAAVGPVVALAGDLSLLHDVNGFLLAERPACVFVVVNNDGGGIFSFLPQSRFPEGFDRAFGTPHGRDLGLLAAFHGLDHQRIGLASELGARVEEAVTSGRIALLEVRTDRAANVDVHRAIEGEVTSAVDAFLEEG